MLSSQDKYLETCLLPSILKGTVILTNQIIHISNMSLSSLPRVSPGKIPPKVLHNASCFNIISSQIASDQEMQQGAN